MSNRESYREGFEDGQNSVNTEEIEKMAWQAGYSEAMEKMFKAFRAAYNHKSTEGFQLYQDYLMEKAERELEKKG